jgi:hypothetical protein
LPGSSRHVPEILPTHRILFTTFSTKLPQVGKSPVRKRASTKLYPGQQPLANANYAYDAVVSMALAIDKAHSTYGPAINAVMTQVTNPLGTACYSYGQCCSLLKRGKKINYQGASGDLDYNKYHNTFGPYGAFRCSLTGQEVQVQVLSAQELAKATP